jgi:hypothetical protein
MGALLFDRACTLAVGDVAWTGLRVRFEVTKTSRVHPNPAEITIWNLSRESRAALVRGVSVRLTAGYRENAELLFAGQVVDVDAQRDGPDWPCKLTCRDGDAAWRASTRRAYGSSVPLVQIVERTAEDMGLPLSAQARSLLQAGGVSHGPLVQHGYAHDELDAVLRSLGMEWSIQDGALQILSSGGATVEPAILLTPETGLIGSPRPSGNAKSLVTAKTAATLDKATRRRLQVVVVSLLQPGLRPGRQVVLQSSDVSGTFRVDRVVHKGDTHGTDWYSEAELRSL